MSLVCTKKRLVHDNTCGDSWEAATKMRHNNQEPKSGRDLYRHGSLPGARRQICDLGHFSVPLLKGTSSILATFRISRISQEIFAITGV